MEKCRSSFCHTHSAILETVFPEAAGIHHMDVHSMIPTNRAELPQGCCQPSYSLQSWWVFAELSVNALLLLEWKTSTKYLSRLLETHAWKRQLLMPMLHCGR